MTDRTPAQILEELRDIHLPPVPDAQPGEFVWYPFAIVFVVAAALFAIRQVRHNRWKRMARRELAAIANAGTSAARLLSLRTLLDRMRPHLRRDASARLQALSQSPPKALYLPDDRVSDDDCAQLLTALRRMLGP